MENNILELADFNIIFKGRYGPGSRKKIQSLLVAARKSGDTVQAHYDSIGVLIDSVFDKTKSVNIPFNEFVDNDMVTQEEFNEIVKAFLEYVKHDDNIFITIGTFFDVIELTPEQMTKLKKNLELGQKEKSEEN